jgi:hypothetical protein
MILGTLQFGAELIHFGALVPIKTFRQQNIPCRKAILGLLMREMMPLGASDYRG